MQMFQKYAANTDRNPIATGQDVSIGGSRMLPPSFWPPLGMGLPHADPGKGVGRVSMRPMTKCNHNCPCYNKPTPKQHDFGAYIESCFL